MNRDVYNGATLMDSGQHKRLTRSTLQFWWPTMLLGLLTVGLCLLWPHGRYAQAVARPMRLPEPGAAYVTLAEGAQSLYLKLDIFTSPSGLGFGRAQGGLDVREAPTTRVRPPPERLSAPVNGPWQLADVALSSLPMPRLSDLPVELPAPTTIPVTNCVRVFLSSGLRQAVFTFDLPRAVLPTTAGRVRCHVELDAAGRVNQLLMEKDELPLDSRGVEAAISRGRGAGPAQGLVDIVWQ